MGNIITPVLPHDLPENWNDTQYVSPGGTEVGLTEKHGYNYLMKQVNNSQKAINELDSEMEEIYKTLANKAPAGYGIGSGPKEVKDDLDNYIYGGLYAWNTGVSHAPFDWGEMLVLPATEYASNTTQLAISLYPANAIAIRRKLDGVFSPWEWVNAPMELGKEYRTTERHLGNPVYKKMDSNGVIWWSTDQSTWKREAERVGSYSKTETDTLLANKASKETQDKVMATGVGSETVSVDASNLGSYLGSLPRFLTKDLTINVSGTCTSKIYIEGFYGPGTLVIQSDTLGNAIINELEFVRCSCHLKFKNLEFHIRETITTNPEGALVLDGCQDVQIEGCSFSDPYHTSSRWQSAGVYAKYNTFCIVAGCTIKDLSYAVIAYKNSIVSVSGGTYSGISIGATVDSCGIIMQGENFPSTTLGGGTNRKQGGLIVKGDGTLL